MKNTALVVSLCCLALAFSSAAVAKGKGGRGPHAAAKANVHVDGLRGLARADRVAGSHGLKGRDVARDRGANRSGFCPPGQAKKPGRGSRFAC